MWRSLADDLAGDAYRAALSRLTGVDLGALAPRGQRVLVPDRRVPGAPPRPAREGRDARAVVQRGVGRAHGGCLRILNTADEEDVDVELLPELGWSARVRAARTTRGTASPR